MRQNNLLMLTHTHTFAMKKFNEKNTTGWSGVEFSRVNEQNERVCGEKFKRGNEITHVSVSLLRPARSFPEGVKRDSLPRPTPHGQTVVCDSRRSLFAISPGIRETRRP